MRLLRDQNFWDFVETKTFGNETESFLSQFFWDRYQYSQTEKVLIEKSWEETSHSGLIVVDVKDAGNIGVAMALLVMEAQVVQVVVD